MLTAPQLLDRLWNSTKHKLHLTGNLFIVRLDDVKKQKQKEELGGKNFLKRKRNGEYKKEYI